jgi:hypothetical protein
MKNKSIAAVIALYGVIVMAYGCSTTPARPCKSNDECAEKASCSVGTGWCEFWESPLNAKLIGDWKNATVGVPYSVEYYEASGGIPPYTWILNDGNTSSYPAWLTVTGSGTNNEKAILHNIDLQHLPDQPTVINIKITVLDYTKREGSKKIRVDNQGVSIQETLTITDCSDNSCSVCTTDSKTLCNKNDGGSVRCSDVKTIQKCWYDDDGCFAWRDQQGLICNGRNLETCTVAANGTVTCVCSAGSLGTFPDCFSPTNPIETYCSTSQCFPVTPTGQESCAYEPTPDVWSAIDCSDSSIGGSSLSAPECQDGIIDFCGQDGQYLDKARIYTCYNADKTKQDSCKCYDSNGAEQTCTSTSIAKYGEVVVDSLTKLMWQRYVTSDTTRYPWQNTANPSNTAAAYCNTLNSNGYGGYNTDWRLPTPIELQSLVDYNISSGATIDTEAFPGTPATWFWSSSSDVYNTNYAWHVEFSTGVVEGYDKALSYYVRCVRSGP